MRPHTRAHLTKELLRWFLPERNEDKFFFTHKEQLVVLQGEKKWIIKD
jgi:hypothetical protein